MIMQFQHNCLSDRQWQERHWDLSLPTCPVRVAPVVATVAMASQYDLDEAAAMIGDKSQSLVPFECLSVAHESRCHASESPLVPVTEVTVPCWFKCGYSGTPDKTNFRNVATKQYPRWVCHPCNSVRQCIERQVKNNP